MFGAWPLTHGAIAAASPWRLRRDGKQVVHVAEVAVEGVLIHRLMTDGITCLSILARDDAGLEKKQSSLQLWLSALPRFPLLMLLLLLQFPGRTGQNLTEDALREMIRCQQATIEFLLRAQGPATSKESANPAGKHVGDSR